MVIQAATAFQAEFERHINFLNHCKSALDSIFSKNKKKQAVFFYNIEMSFKVAHNQFEMLKAYSKLDGGRFFKIVELLPLSVVYLDEYQNYFKAMDYVFLKLSIPFTCKVNEKHCCIYLFKLLVDRMATVSKETDAYLQQINRRKGIRYSENEE